MVSGGRADNFMSGGASDTENKFVYTRYTNH
jgi:hypothetical protein